MCVAVEDTFDDASKRTAMNVKVEDVKTDFQKIFRHVVKAPIDGRRIRDIIT